VWILALSLSDQSIHAHIFICSNYSAFVGYTPHDRSCGCSVFVLRARLEGFCQVSGIAIRVHTVPAASICGAMPPPEEAKAFDPAAPDSVLGEE
jgi:hypothetical protein